MSFEPYIIVRGIYKGVQVSHAESLSPVDAIHAESEARPGPARKRWNVSDFGLVAGSLASCIVIAFTLFAGRPINDDYWAWQSQSDYGFWGSLTWYYTEFQGNISSWFFILLHEQQFLNGISPFASSISVLISFVILGLACWGGLSFIGLRLPGGWRSLAALVIATVVSWLSLGSAISPNSFTAVFYVHSTIVHTWPWLLALIALGVIFRKKSLRAGAFIAVIIGFFAGSLGLAEGVLLVMATIAMFVWRYRWSQTTVQLSAVRGWTLGLSAGIFVQLVSPGTWGRAGGVGPESGLVTNAQAVERILSKVNSLTGSNFGDSVLGFADVNLWVQVLVPLAVFGDLIVRPGLIGVVVLAGLWAVKNVELSLDRSELRRRIIVGAIIVLIAASGYAISGALYAYAGRHVAGLACVVTLLGAGFGAYLKPLWSTHMRITWILSIAASTLFLILGWQQVSAGIERSRSWDAALIENLQLISDGQTTNLVNVPFQAGLSSSGLRDHEGGFTSVYIDWVESNALKLPDTEGVHDFNDSGTMR